jgi:4-hydroxybenzoate polyprenyltransferase
MEHPPEAGPWLLPGGVAIQIVGLALAPLVSLAFFATCLAFAILGVLYSRPVPRFKARPWPSLFTVMIGQGMLGAIAGACAVTDATFGRELAGGVLGAAFLVGGLYPISQVFQMEEDRARGDRTLALALGRRGTVRVASALFALGAVCLALSSLSAGRRAEAIMFALLPLPMTFVASWACAPSGNGFRKVTALQIGASLAFGAYAAVRIFG